MPLIVRWPGARAGRPRGPTGLPRRSTSAHDRLAHGAESPRSVRSTASTSPACSPERPRRRRARVSPTITTTRSKRCARATGSCTSARRATPIDELYNLRDDPGETTNRYDEEPRSRGALAELAEAFRADLGDKATGADGNVRPIGRVAEGRTLTSTTRATRTTWPSTTSTTGAEDRDGRHSEPRSRGCARSAPVLLCHRWQTLEPGSQQGGTLKKYVSRRNRGPLRHVHHRAQRGTSPPIRAISSRSAIAISAGRVSTRSGSASDRTRGARSTPTTSSIGCWTSRSPTASS